MLDAIDTASRAATADGRRPRQGRGRRGRRPVRGGRWAGAPTPAATARPAPTGAGRAQPAAQLMFFPHSPELPSPPFRFRRSVRNHVVTVVTWRPAREGGRSLWINPAAGPFPIATCPGRTGQSLSETGSVSPLVGANRHRVLCSPARARQQTPQAQGRGRTAVMPEHASSRRSRLACSTSRAKSTGSPIGAGTAVHAHAAPAGSTTARAALRPLLTGLDQPQEPPPHRARRRVDGRERSARRRPQAGRGRRRSAPSASASRSSTRSEPGFGRAPSGSQRTHRPLPSRAHAEATAGDSQRREPPEESSPATRTRAAAAADRPADRRRPRRTPAEWIGGSPERIMAWAFALGLILILVAISTADAERRRGPRRTPRGLRPVAPARLRCLCASSTLTKCKTGVSSPSRRGSRTMKTQMSRFHIHDEMSAPEGSLPVLKGAHGVRRPAPELPRRMAGSPAALAAFAASGPSCATASCPPRPWSGSRSPSRSTTAAPPGARSTSARPAWPGSGSTRSPARATGTPPTSARPRSCATSTCCSSSTAAPRCTSTRRHARPAGATRSCWRRSRTWRSSRSRR